jgi:hypothetical protein
MLGERPCHQEGHFERLHVVEPGIADRLVAVQECFLVNRVGATEALRDVVAGHFHVQAAWDCPQGVVHLEEAAHLVNDVVEIAGLVPVRGRYGVPVHGIGDPEHLCA